MIIINPREGLCNRLRAIDSAIALAAETKTKLHVIWEMDSKCNCRFSDLFDWPAGVHRITELEQNAGVENVKSRVAYMFSHYGNCYFTQQDFHNSLTQEDLVKIVLNHRHVYLSTWNRFFHRSSRRAALCFIPTLPLRKIIDGYDTASMAGIHVRRSDNKYAIAHSPVERFIEQMKREVEIDNNVKFFLASDEPSVETELEKVFPGRISVHEKNSLDRNNPLAIPDAVVDLYCLAYSKKIIGSFWSSFSSLAANIYGIECVTIRENKFSLAPFATGKYPLKVRLNPAIQVGEGEAGGLKIVAARGKTLQLNAVSAAILSQCSQSITVSEILAVFAQKYPDEADIEQNVIQIMEYLLAFNVITVNIVN